MRAPDEVPPERLNNREIGMRSEWFESRLRLNATAFEMALTDRQGAAAVADATAPTGFTIQVMSQGDVDLDGFELETNLAVTDRFTLEAAAGWIDYVMANLCINNGPSLIPSPIEESWNLGGRYDLPMRNNGNLSIGMDYSFVGAQETHPGGLTPEQNTALGCSGTGALNFQDSRYRLGQLWPAEPTVRYEPGDKWSLTLYGSNLTDEHYGNNAQAFGRGFWTAGGPLVGINDITRNAIAEFRGRPREYSVMFQYNFY